MNVLRCVFRLMSLVLVLSLVGLAGVHPVKGEQLAPIASYDELPAKHDKYAGVLFCYFPVGAVAEVELSWNVDNWLVPNGSNGGSFLEGEDPSLFLLFDDILINSDTMGGPHFYRYVEYQGPGHEVFTMGFGGSSVEFVPGSHRTEISIMLDATVNEDGFCSGFLYLDYSHTNFVTGESNSFNTYQCPLLYMERV